MYEKKRITSNLCNAKNDDPAGRSTRLLEEAQDQLDADEHDHGGSDSGKSRKGQRREWATRNLAKGWHQESAAKWITSYAAQLSTGSPPPTIPEKTSMAPGEEDLDAPGGEVYETVKELMKLQNIAGDPQAFIPGYKKTHLNIKRITSKGPIKS